MRLHSVIIVAGVALLRGIEPIVSAQKPETTAERLPPVIVRAPVLTGGADTQRVPVSVTMVSSNQVDATGIRNFNGLAGEAPNLSATDSGTRSFGDIYGIRGQVNTRFFSDPSVVVYVDDVPYGNPSSYSTELYYIDSIDVLRGPQGSVFGKNNQAGVLNITTPMPGDRYAAEGALSFGNYDAQDYRGNLSGPIIKDKLSWGVAGDYSRRDGFMVNTNLNTNPDNLSGFNGRGVLHWTPQEDWDIALRISGEDSDDGQERIQSLTAKPFKTASDFDGVTHVRADSESLRISHTAAWCTITSISARRYWQLDPFTLDIDFTPFVGNYVKIKRDQEQWTEEIRLQSPHDQENWKWQGGLFYSTSKFHGDDMRNFFAFPPGIFVNEETKFKLGEDNYAAFSQVTYTFREKWDFTLGTRLDYTVKNIHRTKNTTFGAVPTVSDDQDFFNAAPKLTIDYHVTDTVMLYGSTGIGFMPGGFSAFIDPPSSANFDTEQAWSSEIGVKSAWFNKKLIANVALFWSKIQDYQVERSVPNSTDLTIVNANEVTSRGVEVELTALPCDGLQLQAAFGYTDAYFNQFKDPTNLSGNQVPYVPEFTVRLAGQYKHRTGLGANVEWLGFGRTFYDETNAKQFEQSSYGILNARVGFEYKWFGIYAFGHNLTDTRYYSNITTELNAGVPGAPQTVGLMATAKF